MQFAKNSTLGVVVLLSTLAACTSARVQYSIAPAASVDQISENDYVFRIPRSQIMIKTAGPGLSPAVVDATPSGTETIPIPLPFNKDFAYTISIVDTAAEGLSRESFFSAVYGKQVSVFPAPSCAVATIKLYNRNADTPIQFLATAVPTELALPASEDATLTASTLYLIRPASNLASTTNLSVTYLDNTKIVSKIGSSVTDNISAALKDITAVAVAAGTVLGAGMPMGPGGVSSGTANSWHYVGTAVVTVAANDSVDLVPIPKAGNIVMNTTCGASTTSTGSTSNMDQATQDLAAAIADAQQIYKAWKQK